MTTQNQWMERIRPNFRLWLLLLFPPIAVLIGGMTMGKPGAAVVFLAAIPLLYFMVSLPELATLAVIFILYTNTADVAVEFHGVPYVVGTSFFLMLAIPLFHYLVIRGERIIIYPALPWIGLFGLVQVVGAVFSAKPEISVPKVLEFVIEGLAIYVLITNVIRSRTMLRQACWTVIAAGAVMAIFPLFQQMTGTFKNNYWGLAQVSEAAFDTGERTAASQVWQPRLAGTIGEQNRFAQVMLMVVPIAMFRWWSEQPGRKRWLAMGATGLISLGVVLSFSRGAAVGFLVMLVAMAYMRDITRKQLSIVLCGLVMLLVIMPQYATRITRLKGVWGLIYPEKMSQQTKPDGALRGRAVEMSAAARMVTDYPLFGVGPGMFRYKYPDYSKVMTKRVSRQMRESHNLYLGIAAENGVLGLGCFLVIVYVTIRDLIRVRRLRQSFLDERALMATGFLLAIVAYLTTGIGLHFAFVRFFWLILALAAVAGRLSIKEYQQQFTAPAAAQA